MAHPILPNTDNLVAVALVINRSRDGPSLVFHYPPEARRDGSGSSESEPEPSDEIFDHDDIILERLLSRPENPLPNQAFIQKGNHDDHLITNAGTQVVPWEHVAGFPTRDLANLLTPGKSYHKKLFQVSLDNLYCVSCPVHVPENGIWKKKKRMHRSKSQKRSDGFVAPSDTDVLAKNGGEKEKPPTAREEVSEKQPEDGDDKDKEKQKEKEKEDKISSMTMFNVVFILTPRRHEVRELVNALYLNIIKKVNKAFKYSQQHSDFVWKESKRILALKEKGREDKTAMNDLWKEILKAHSLAGAVKEIYESLSQNKIVGLQLDTASGPLNLSMQVPMPFYVADLPPESDETQRGLWLTTANTFIPDEALEDAEFLDKNFALLLMENDKKIIAQLQADSDPSAVPMVEFVRLCKPTMSLYQVGQANILTHGQVRKFAQHFIFWRRAIAIPPLHARDVYIMSPNCDLSRLPRASQEWGRTYPLAPPLTNFLADLSYAPRPYKHFCPSKAHRPNYLAMLAWLMRGGWVTQLCTFAYVVVWPEIIYEVEYEVEAEDLAKDKEAAQGGSSGGGGGGTTSGVTSSSESTSTSAPSQSPTTTTERIAEAARIERLNSRAQRAAAEKATAHARKAPPAKTDHPSVNKAPYLQDITPHVILDAKKATGKDSRYLSAIAARFPDDKTRAAWQRFWRYFDGQCALEKVALHEDMKRKEAWNLLTAMSEYLLCVRHW